MSSLSLTPRLKALAKLVAPCRSVIDIGCDHGLLDVALLQQNEIDWAIGTDNKSEPLRHAKANAKAAGVTGLQLVETDGVSGITRQAQAAVMAGIGCHTACQIMTKGAAYLRRCDKLILQINTQLDQLRQYLQANNWQIVAETCLVDKGQYYELITVQSGTMELSELQLAFGRFLPYAGNKVFIKHYQDRQVYLAGLLQEMAGRSAASAELRHEQQAIAAMLTKTAAL